MIQKGFEYQDDGFDFEQTSRVYEEEQKEIDMKNLAEHCKFITQGADVSFEELEDIARTRQITHIMPIPILEDCAACQSVSFLTKDTQGNVYIDLGLKPMNELGGGWIELEQPFQAEADKLCWQTDGGSVWYAPYNDAYYSSTIKLVVRGPREDTQYGQTIDELTHRQYYSEKIQIVSEVKEADEN